MSVLLRVLLIIASIFTFLYVGRKIRKSQMKLEDAFIWVVMSVVLIVLSVFPGIAFEFSELLGFQAPVNFIFLFVICFLLMKVFLLSIKISQLENKVSELTQEVALRERKKGIDENAK